MIQSFLEVFGWIFLGTLIIQAACLWLNRNKDSFGNKKVPKNEV